jgi:hypothetical protein
LMGVKARVAIVANKLSKKGCLKGLSK